MKMTEKEVKFYRHVGQMANESTTEIVNSVMDGRYRYAATRWVKYCIGMTMLGLKPISIKMSVKMLISPQYMKECFERAVAQSVEFHKSTPQF